MSSFHKALIKSCLKAYAKGPGESNALLSFKNLAIVKAEITSSDSQELPAVFERRYLTEIPPKPILSLCFQKRLMLSVPPKLRQCGFFMPWLSCDLLAATGREDAIL